MASIIIGRAKCPECGFEAAHVKQSEKCVYRYCPGCGINGPHARTPAQIENMTRGMRPVDDARKPTSTPPTEGDQPASAAATPRETTATPAAPAKPSTLRRGLFA